VTGRSVLTQVETTRIELEDTNLSESLVNALQRYEGDAKQGQVLEQVGRVGANLGADNGERLNRHSLSRPGADVSQQPGSPTGCELPTVRNQVFDSFQHRPRDPTGDRSSARRESVECRRIGSW
jgi:hypothetical protein